MLKEPIHILWDASHIWGLMAMHAMHSYGLNCRLIKAIEITQDDYISKWQGSLLLVPGGNARQKARALGVAGREAIRQFLAVGGKYIGICGGAGFALTQSNLEDGLNICPWQRAEYPQRLYHLISGNVIAKDAHNRKIQLPVWWPGRFAPGHDSDVEILARYCGPGQDLWLADLPVARVPANISKYWREKHQFDPGLCFPEKQPLIIKGQYGKGQYLLSYAHPETPECPDANALFAQFLKDFHGLEIKNKSVAAWKTEPVKSYDAQPNSLNSFCFSASLSETLLAAQMLFNKIINLGCELRLLFKRTSWLWGWRQGMPGIACNNLLAALSVINEMHPNDKSLQLWQKEGKNFTYLFKIFIEKAESYFWTIRLLKTLDQEISPEMRSKLNNERDLLFGHPMHGGGIIEKLLFFLEELIYLSQKE